VLKHATNHTQNRCTQAEPAAQTAHLVFADAFADAEKTKRAIFCQRYEINNIMKNKMTKLILTSLCGLQGVLTNSQNLQNEIIHKHLNYKP